MEENCTNFIKEMPIKVPIVYKIPNRKGQKNLPMIHNIQNTKCIEQRKHLKVRREKSKSHRKTNPLEKQLFSILLFTCLFETRLLSVYKSPECPGTLLVGHTELDLTEALLSLPPKFLDKGMCHHHPAFIVNF